MYYTTQNREVYFSTSLKDLLKASKIQRTLNYNSAEAFITNGYVYGKETLIEGVYKLDFGKAIKISREGIQELPCTYSVEDIGEEAAEKTYGSAIRAAVNACLEQTSRCQIAMPLSGGLDSNCILGTIRRQTDENIKVFTIGSANGSNEIPTAEQIASVVSNINHYSYVVDNSMFHMLPEIIWRLDGCVYESGVFLQYALARLVSQENCPYLICGESNNEIQSEKYVSNLNAVLNNEIGYSEQLLYSRNPFIATNLMVLKKSSIMLNSFHVTGLYPYKDKQNVVCAHSLRKINGSERKLFRKECMKAISPKVGDLLNSIGGTTGTSSVLTNSQLHQIKKCMKKDKLISTVHQTGRNIRYAEKYHAEKQFLRKIKGRLMNNKAYWDDRPVKELYIRMFYELFISGEYDALFSHEDLNACNFDIFTKIGLSSFSRGQ